MMVPAVQDTQGMTAPSMELPEELETLQRRREQLTDVPETPRSLMSVIEYSLDEQRKAEEWVNQLLGYFLDPSAPHGMGDEFLRAFLEVLPENLAFDEDTYDLSDVRVSDQVAVQLEETVGEASGSTGFADLLISAQNEWFLLVELKFGAGENNLRGDGPSQTEFYYQAALVGGVSKEKFESGNFYLYLHPNRSSPPENQSSRTGRGTGWRPTFWSRSYRSIQPDSRTGRSYTSANCTTTSRRSPA